MIIIENSNIVDWDNYPEYICAIIMQTTEDLKMNSGLICPKGEEITWLLDKSPKVIGDDVEIANSKINCLGGIGPSNGAFDFPADIKEIHYKPKPIVELKKQSEVFA